MSEEILMDIKEEIKSNKKVRVAINGFGRIGRQIFRAGFNDPQIEFVAINDLSSPESLRYFLQFDSSYGKFEHNVSFEEDFLIVGDRRIRIFSQKNIEQMPWKDLDIDVVAECTGKFTKKEDAQFHIENGAKKVLIAAPATGDVFYLVRGVNDFEYNDSYKIVSNGSCTTNSMCAIVDQIHKRYKIKKGLFSTIHSVTGDQRILDAVHPKFRRGRSAPYNIVPTTTGAAKAVTKLIPELEGKLNGIAYRVPTPTGSVTDMNLEVEENVSVLEINNFLKELCQTKLNGIVEFSTEELVSSDIVGNTNSGIIDSLSTQVIDSNLVRLVVWYDNECGFSNRMIEVIKLISN